jgi:hypothetical protein
MSRRALHTSKNRVESPEAGRGKEAFPSHRMGFDNQNSPKKMKSDRFLHRGATSGFSGIEAGSSPLAELCNTKTFTLVGPEMFYHCFQQCLAFSFFTSHRLTRNRTLRMTDSPFLSSPCLGFAQRKSYLTSPGIFILLHSYSYIFSR